MENSSIQLAKIEEVMAIDRRLLMMIFREFWRIFKDLLWGVPVYFFTGMTVISLVIKCPFLPEVFDASQTPSSIMFTHDLHFRIGLRGFVPLPFVFNEFLEMASVVYYIWEPLAWTWLLLAIPTIIAWMRLRSWIAKQISAIKLIIYARLFGKIAAHVLACAIVGGLIGLTGIMISELPHSIAKTGFHEQEAEGYVDCKGLR